MSRAVQSLQCPSCGGALDFGHGSHVASCSYCSRSCLVTGGDGVLRFVVKPRLSKDALRRIIHERVLCDSRVDPRLKDRADLVREEYWFVPFLYFTGRRIGHFQSPAQGLSVINAYYETIIPACWLENDVMERVEVRPRALGEKDQPLHPFRLDELQRLGVVYDLDLPLDELKDRASHPPAMASGETEVVEHRFKLIYLPLYVADFTYEGELISATACAREGKVIFARVPERKSLRLPVMLTLVGTTGLVLAGLVRVLVALLQASGEVLLTSFFGLVLGSLVVGALCFLLAAAWDALRFPSEVVFDPGGVQRVKVSRPAKTWFEKVGGAILGTYGRAIEEMAKEGRKEPYL